MLDILLCNDDGVNAEGILSLWEALSKQHNVHLFAPDRDRSGASNSLTLSMPIRVNTLNDKRVSVQGTPTDCVHLAITGFLDQQPDMVISGINAGSNLGDDVWYSGTVAAAREGRFLGLPAIAVSMIENNPIHFDTGVKVVLDLIRLLQTVPLKSNLILNVNIPDVPYDQLAGFEITRLGERHCAEPTIEQVDPRGRKVYWVGPPGKAAECGPGTDFYAVAQNKVSITPLKIDFTDYEACDQLRSWLEQGKINNEI